MDAEPAADPSRLFETPNGTPIFSGDGSQSSRSKTDGTSAVLRKDFQALEEKVARMMQVVIEPIERRVSGLEAQRSKLDWRLSEFDVTAQAIRREMDALSKHSVEDEAAKVQWKEAITEEIQEWVEDAMNGLEEQLKALVQEETTRAVLRSDGASASQIKDLEQRVAGQLLSTRQEAMSRVGDLESELSDYNSKLRRDMAVLAGDLRKQFESTSKALEQNSEDLKLVDAKAAALSDGLRKQFEVTGKALEQNSRDLKMVDEKADDLRKESDLTRRSLEQNSRDIKVVDDKAAALSMDLRKQSEVTTNVLEHNSRNMKLVDENAAALADLRRQVEITSRALDQNRQELKQVDAKAAVLSADLRKQSEVTSKSLEPIRRDLQLVDESVAALNDLRKQFEVTSKVVEQNSREVRRVEEKATALSADLRKQSEVTNKALEENSREVKRVDEKAVALLDGWRQQCEVTNKALEQNRDELRLVEEKAAIIDDLRKQFEVTGRAIEHNRQELKLVDAKAASLSLDLRKQSDATSKALEQNSRDLKLVDEMAASLSADLRKHSEMTGKALEQTSRDVKLVDAKAAALSDDLRKQFEVTSRSLEQNRQELKMLGERAGSMPGSPNSAGECFLSLRLVPHAGELSRLSNQIETLKYRVAATEIALSKTDTIAGGRSRTTQEFDDVHMSYDSPTFSSEQSPGRASRSPGREGLSPARGRSAGAAEDEPKSGAAQVQRWAATELDKMKSMLVSLHDMVRELSQKQAASQNAASTFPKTPRGGLRGDMSERGDVALADDVHRLRVNVDGLICNVRELEAKMSSVSSRLSEELPAAIDQLRKDIAQVSASVAADAVEDPCDAVLAATLGRSWQAHANSLGAADVVRVELGRRGDGIAGKHGEATSDANAPYFEETLGETTTRRKSFDRPQTASASSTLCRSAESCLPTRNTKASPAGSACSASTVGHPSPSDCPSEPEATTIRCADTSSPEFFPQSSEGVVHELRSELVGVRRMLNQMAKVSATVSDDDAGMGDALAPPEGGPELGELAPTTLVG